MATARNAVMSDREAYQGLQESEDKPVPIDRLRAFISAVNIAPELDEGILGEIGDRVMQEYRIDETSRSDWENRHKTSMDLAMQVAEEKNYPWPKAANIKFPLVTTAAIQFAARAYPAIINGRDVVKAAVNGADDGQPEIDPQSGQPVVNPETNEPVWRVPPGVKQDRADRVSRHMSWQCLEEMTSWEEDTDKLLHIVPIVGCAFRKSWFDPVMGRNRSEMVTAKNLVVNYWAKDMESCPRISQEISLYPIEIKERERSGLFIAHEYGKSADKKNDDDAPVEFIEQHRWLDLDEDNFPEPYIVTVHKETGKVARIIARFDEEGVDVNDDGEVSRIEPVHYFTKYSFIPNPEGGFYDIGFGWLLEPLNEAINGTINQMLDAGHLQNTGGGFIGDGLRLRGGSARFRPGEYKRVQASGGTIRENVVTLPFAGPSQTLFNLLGLLIEAARDITSVKDVMTGDQGPANEAAARTLARIEQGMKVFSAIYKRLFRAFKSEYRKLYNLNSLYLDEIQYFNLMDTPEAVKATDYQQNDLDISPAADPNMVSDMQKMARADFLIQFLEDPLINPVEARRRIFEAANFEDVEKLVLEEMPPNPQLAKDADEMEIKKREQEIREREIQAKIEADQRAKAADIESRERMAKQQNAIRLQEIQAREEQAELDRETQLLIARMAREERERERAEAEEKARVSKEEDREHERYLRVMDGKATPDLENKVEGMADALKGMAEGLARMADAVQKTAEQNERSTQELMRVLAADSEIVTDEDGRIRGSRRVLN